MGQLVRDGAGVRALEQVDDGLAVRQERDGTTLALAQLLARQHGLDNLSLG